MAAQTSGRIVMLLTSADAMREQHEKSLMQLSELVAIHLRLPGR
jgi:hypothetical protein